MNLVGPSWRWKPGNHKGLVVPSGGHHPIDYYTYKVKPPESMDLHELYPISTNTSPMNLATSLD